MFVNVTHPSQIRDKKVQRTVKAFTSAHNQRRRKVDRRQEPQDDSRTGPGSPCSPCSTDEDDRSARVSGKDSPAPSLRVSEDKHHPESSLSQQQHEEDPDVEESEHALQSVSHSLVHFREQQVEHSVQKEPEEIIDLYPAVGNIALPFSEIGLSPQAAARLRRLMQYYIEVDGPTSIWRPQQLVESSKVHVFKRNFFALSMTEPVIIETIFAGSQFRLDLKSNPNAKASAVVLQHRGKVLKMVQERIMNTETMLNDVTFFAIIGMITLDAFCGNWTSFKSNLDGFRILVALRGGTEKLGWQGWFQTHLGWIELQWATHMSKNKLNMPKMPAYPRHPFPPALSICLSKLPVGLREAALSRKLSIEVLNFLRNVNTWTTTYDDERKGKYYLEGLKLISNATELMGKYNISSGERILSIGTLAYIIETDGRTKEKRVPRGLEDHLVGIDMLYSSLSLDDGLLWAAVVIAASNDNPQVPSVNKCRMLDRILDSDMDGSLGSWEDVRKCMRKFFWNKSIEKTWESCWNIALDRRKKRVSSREKSRRLSMSWVIPQTYGIDRSQIRRAR